LSGLILGGSQERGKRAGTENLPGIMGMAAALDEAVMNAEEDRKKVTTMRDRLISGLSEIPHSVLNGDPERRLPGNANFCFEGVNGEALLMMLDEKGISASSGSACTAGSPEPSHVLLALGLSDEMARSSLRLTIDENNTPDEIETIITEVTAAVSKLRMISRY
jgi:cysteine desulfurase